MPAQQILLGRTTAASAPATYVTSNLVFNVDADDPASVSQVQSGGNTWVDLQGSNNVVHSSYLPYVSPNGVGAIDYGSGSNIGTFNTPVGANSVQTWEVWTNAVQTTSFPGSPYSYYLHNNAGAQTTGSSWMNVGLDASNRYYAAFDGQYGSMNTGANTNQTGNGQNVHLVLTWDNNTQKFYINGSLEVSLPLTTNFSTIGSYSSTTTIGEAAGGNYRPINGLIYSVRCWDVALSASDVLANFNGNRAKFGI